MNISLLTLCSLVDAKSYGLFIYTSFNQDYVHIIFFLVSIETTNTIVVLLSNHRDCLQTLQNSEYGHITFFLGSINTTYITDVFMYLIAIISTV